MCCSPIMKLVCKVSMFLSAIAAIHLGLMAIGYDALTVLKLHEYSQYLGCIFGVAGVISLVTLCMWCMKHGCSCGATGSCNCK